MLAGLIYGWKKSRIDAGAGESFSGGMAQRVALAKRVTMIGRRIDHPRISGQRSFWSMWM
jgi:hypothetical protein